MYLAAAAVLSDCTRFCHCEAREAISTNACEGVIKTPRDKLSEASRHVLSASCKAQVEFATVAC